MRSDGKMRRGTIVAAMLLGAFLSACGTDSPSGSTTQTKSGVVTVGTPTAGLKTCTSCHAAQTANWMLTKHANVEPLGNLYSQGNPTYGQIGSCTTRCHDSQYDSSQLTAGYTGNTVRPVVGCESCHGGGKLHADGGGAGPIGYTTMTATVIGTTSTVQASGLFLTCTGCHQLLDPADPASAATTTAAHNPATGITPTGNNYVITDTHFATPGDWSGAGGANIKAITGYAMDFADEKVCINCHNPHGSPTQNREWAVSAHGDKGAFNQNATGTGYFSGAWAHYNWSLSNRINCQRCHTTTGFSVYADALRTGNADLAAQIRASTASPPPIAADNAFKPEMLKCNGCHTDNKGSLRNPGSITADYSYSTGTYKLSDASYAYPDVDKSNVCMACHTGLESGDTIKNLSLSVAPTVTTMTNIGFINSHYLTGGGTVFTVTGYEFGSRSYENPASYQHNQIGMENFRSTGSAGPCVGCHMSRPNGNGNHLFLPVSRFDTVRYNSGTVGVAANSAVVTGTSTAWTGAGINTAGDAFVGPDSRIYLIASVDSDTQITLTSPYRGGTASGQSYAITRPGKRIVGVASEVCFNCHAGATSALVDQLNEERLMFVEALEALKFFLDRQGFCFIEAYPYFHKLRYNDGTVSVSSGGTVVTGSGTLFSTASISATTDRLRAADGTAYEIQSIDNDTQITLKTPYLGLSVSGSEYSIIISGAANAVKNWDPTNAGETSGGNVGKNNMGAAFNFNLLEHDPGAYVHNRMYVKRLIYDALDWADDNALNYSVGVSLSSLDDTVYAWSHEAKIYLLPNGVIPGIQAERP